MKLLKKLFDRLPLWAVATFWLSLPFCFFIVPALVVTQTGCTTIGGSNQLDVARVANIAGLAAQLGSTAYLQKNPEARPYFLAAYNGLGALDHAGNYDPAAFASALSMLPIRELSAPNGNLYIMAAVLVWDELAQRSVNVDKTTWVAPVLRAVRSGIGRALGIAPGVRVKGIIP